MLAAAERKLHVLNCLVVVAAVRIGLTMFGFSLVDRLTRRIAAHKSARSADMARVASGVEAAARRVPGASCLTQALAGRALLARLGQRSTIRIGIDRHSPGALRAHAWLICDGVIVLGGPPSSLDAFNHLVDLAAEQ